MNCNHTEEIWKDILGYEGRYQVSSFGRIRSLARSVCSRHNCCRTIEEKIMKLHLWVGYQLVWLRKPGSHKKFRVHQLVALTFFEKPEGKDYVNHKDKDRTHNCILNLEWCTHKENCEHRDNYVEDVPF